MGIDDSGKVMELSPDPQIPEDVNKLYGLPFGKCVDLKLILSNEKLFGVNLYEACLADKIEMLFAELSSKANAVSDYLRQCRF